METGCRLLVKTMAQNGPMKTSLNDYRLPIEDDVIKACDEVAGLTKKPTDPWSGDHIGFYNTLGAVARTGPTPRKALICGKGLSWDVPGQAEPKGPLRGPGRGVDLKGNTAKGVTFTHKRAQHSFQSAERSSCAGVPLTPLKSLNCQALAIQKCFVRPVSNARLNYRLWETTSKSTSSPR